MPLRRVTQAAYERHRQKVADSTSVGPAPLPPASAPAPSASPAPDKVPTRGPTAMPSSGPGAAAATSTAVTAAPRVGSTAAAAAAAAPQQQQAPPTANPVAPTPCQVAKSTIPLKFLLNKGTREKHTFDSPTRTWNGNLWGKRTKGGAPNMANKSNFCAYLMPKHGDSYEIQSRSGSPNRKIVWNGVCWRLEGEPKFHNLFFCLLRRCCSQVRNLKKT